jgi:putative transposase
MIRDVLFAQKSIADSSSIAKFTSIITPERQSLCASHRQSRWLTSWSYGTNALGQANAILSPLALYLALAADDAARREVYRDFFRTAVDYAPLADLRMALNQDQPLGNSRFYAEIEAMTGQRRELRTRGRPRKNEEKEPLADTAQPRLPI